MRRQVKTGARAPTAVDTATRAPPVKVRVDADILSRSCINWALHLIGDRWSLALIRAAFLGARQFGEFRRHLDISRQTLSLRLKELTALGILKAEPYQLNPVRSHYRLTEKGRALYPNALMSWIWERKWVDDGFPLPVRLMHRSCGQPLTPKCVCAACRMAAPVETLSLSVMRCDRPEVPASRSRRMPSEPKEAAKGAGLGVSVDRWALLVVTAVILGCHQFNRLQEVLRVGSSTLTDRLERLTSAGLLVRRPDLNDRRRHVYVLAPAALDLFPVLATLTLWHQEQMAPGADTISPVHQPCGARFRPLVICNACGKEAMPRDVTFRSLRRAAK